MHDAHTTQTPSTTRVVTERRNPRTVRTKQQEQEDLHLANIWFGLSASRWLALAESCAHLCADAMHLHVTPAQSALSVVTLSDSRSLDTRNGRQNGNLKAVRLEAVSYVQLFIFKGSCRRNPSTAVVYYCTRIPGIVYYADTTVPVWA